MMEEKQASIMQDVREMIAELMRNSGPSEFNNAEDSAAVRGNPQGAVNPLLRDNFYSYCWKRSARKYNSSKRGVFS